MAYTDLKEWIERLKQEDELLVIDAKVNPHLELGTICRYFIDHGPNKALLFTNVDGYEIPVLANAFSTRHRLNLALNVEDKNREQFILDHWNQSIDPVLVEEAPCQEIVHLGDKVDLNSLPIPWHNVGDGGKYISFGVLVTKDLDTGTHNLSYARLQIKTKNKAGIHVTPGKHALINMQKYWEQGKNAPVSVFIGSDPVLKLAAAASPSYEISEYGMAGALRGDAVKVTSSLTNDLLIPAHAEIIIEGECPPDITETEGPFGEFTGYYGPKGERGVLLVKAITHQKNPVYQTLYTGMPVCDNHIMQELLRSAKVWERVKQVIPSVKAVYCPPQAGNGFTVWISMKKRHDGEPKLAMMAAWTAFEYVKHVFVVDEDVNIYDAHIREWVVATRVQADRDVLIIPGMVGMALDPSAQGSPGAPVRLGIFERARNHKAVMGVDCTKPLGVNFEKVVEVPDELIDNVKQRLPELLRNIK